MPRGMRARGCSLLGRNEMDLDSIFKIAGMGILVSVLNLLLTKSGREEYAMMITMAGLILVLVIIVKEVAMLFKAVETIFRF